MFITSLIRASFLAGLIALTLSSPSLYSEPQPADDSLARSILEKSDEIRFPSKAFQVDVDIASNTPGQAVEKRKYRILSKGNDNTVVMILEPASERGQIMLMKGHDLWVFMPNVSQPIRLGLAQRLTGQVANGDLARANFAGDYTPRLLRTDKLDGDDYYVLELLAVDRSVTYHRVLLWVNKTSYRPRKAEFYSLSNRLLKTSTYDHFETMAERQRPTQMRIQDALKIGDTSVLEYSNMKLRDIPDKVFSKDYLKKLQ